MEPRATASPSPREAARSITARSPTATETTRERGLSCTRARRLWTTTGSGTARCCPGRRSPSSRGSGMASGSWCPAPATRSIALRTRCFFPGGGGCWITGWAEAFAQHFVGLVGDDEGPGVDLEDDLPQAHSLESVHHAQQHLFVRAAVHPHRLQPGDAAVHLAEDLPGDGLALFRDDKIGMGGVGPFQHQVRHHIAQNGAVKTKSRYFTAFPLPTLIYACSGNRYLNVRN